MGRIRGRFGLDLVFVVLGLAYIWFKITNNVRLVLFRNNTRTNFVILNYEGCDWSFSKLSPRVKYAKYE